MCAVSEAAGVVLPNKTRNPAMTETFIELSEEDFHATYPLVPNHLNPSAGWATGEDNGCLFETYGEELDFVRKQDPRTIWTLLDGDDGDLYVASGYHLVNRIGYLLSTVPVPGEVSIQVHIEMQRDEETDEANGDAHV
jgi:hypothetical protein